jgi:hypothetical protein
MKMKAMKYWKSESEMKKMARKKNMARNIR